MLVEKGLQCPPIHLAAFSGEIQKVKDGIGSGVDVDQKDATGFTPLHCATCGDQMEVVKFLLGRGANVNAQNINYWTPLRFTWSTEMAALLIANGADVKLANNRGQTVLHGAVNRDNRRGDRELVELLLKNGANPNARAGSTAGSWAGWTPLHVACRNGSRPMVELLLAHGADVNAKTDKGETPLAIAQANNRTAAVQLLKKHGAK